MQAVACHVQADFDALASVVAARALYPGARAFLPAGSFRTVHDFLTLHSHALGLDDPRHPDFSSLERLIIVDCQHAERLGPLQQGRQPRRP